MKSLTTLDMARLTDKVSTKSANTSKKVFFCVILFFKLKLDRNLLPEFNFTFLAPVTT